MFVRVLGTVGAHEHTCLRKPEVPGSRITGNTEARNQTQTLSKSSTCSQPPSCLSSPICPFHIELFVLPLLSTKSFVDGIPLGLMDIAPVTPLAPLKCVSACCCCPTYRLYIKPEGKKIWALFPSESSTLLTSYLGFWSMSSELCGRGPAPSWSRLLLPPLVTCASIFSGC